MQEIQFDFFRGMEAEQYSFYRVPKMLFTAECFRSLSCEAKVLYGLLLDRMSLSIKNRWLDEENRVYIVFKIDEIVELMNCGPQKAVKLLKELDADKGIGLIEKKRLGLGKPNVIYVKNFIIHQTEDDDTEKESADGHADIQNCENQNSGVVESADLKNEESEEYCSELGIAENPGCPISQNQNCENQNFGIVDITDQELPKSQAWNCENQNSGMVNITIQELLKSKSNNTDINNTEFNENEYSDTDLKEKESVIQKDIYPISSYPSIPEERVDVMDRMEACRDVIRENISYSCFEDERYHRRQEVDELIELMIEVLMMPDDAVLRIAGEDKPAAIVKSRFMKLNQGHMEYIMSCLTANTKKVGNIRAYLLTVLYNATLTVNNYYTAEVNHDLHGNRFIQGRV